MVAAHHTPHVQLMLGGFTVHRKLVLISSQVLAMWWSYGSGKSDFPSEDIRQSEAASEF